MPSLPFRSQQSPGAGAGMRGGGFDDDSSVLDQFADVGSRVGIADFVLLGRVKPDLAYAHASHGGCETFLGAEVHHLVRGRMAVEQIEKEIPVK